ncbi:recombinase family protein [Dyadobacter sp. 676]|uniref:Recombinase family protein n=1 Tax=Dyadobacter sp. 676 TaxID=3088362 RepID=A0AAU8FHS4_9BACT
MITGYLPFGADDTFAQKLEQAGCHRIVAEQKMNGRPRLEKLLSELQDGDILIVCRAAHIGSQADFVKTLIRIGLKHAHLVSVIEDIDTLRDTLHFGIQMSR